MIGNLTRGGGFRGVLDYVFGGGRHEKFDRTTFLGGTLAGRTPQQLAREFGDLRQFAPDCLKPVKHVSISVPKPEALTREQALWTFGRIAERMGWDSWTSVAHNDKERHNDYHMVAARITQDGKIVREQPFDVAVVEEVCREAELRFGLQVVASPERTPTGKMKPNLVKAPSKKERAMVERTGAPSWKMILRDAALRVLEARPVSMEAFEIGLGRLGIDIKKTIKKGEIAGLTYIHRESGQIMKGQDLGDAFKASSVVALLTQNLQENSREAALTIEPVIAPPVNEPELRPGNTDWDLIGPDEDQYLWTGLWPGQGSGPVAILGPGESDAWGMDLEIEGHSFNPTRAPRVEVSRSVSDPRPALLPTGTGGKLVPGIPPVATGAATYRQTDMGDRAGWLQGNPPGVFGKSGRADDPYAGGPGNGRVPGAAITVGGLVGDSNRGDRTHGESGQVVFGPSPGGDASPNGNEGLRFCEPLDGVPSREGGAQGADLSHCLPMGPANPRRGATGGAAGNDQNVKLTAPRIFVQELPPPESPLPTYDYPSTSEQEEQEESRPEVIQGQIFLPTNLLQYIGLDLARIYGGDPQGPETVQMYTNQHYALAQQDPRLRTWCGDPVATTAVMLSLKERLRTGWDGVATKDVMPSLQRLGIRPGQGPKPMPLADLQICIHGNLRKALWVESAQSGLLLPEYGTIVLPVPAKLGVEIDWRNSKLILLGPDGQPADEWARTAVAAAARRLQIAVPELSPVPPAPALEPPTPEIKPKFPSAQYLQPEADEVRGLPLWDHRWNNLLPYIDLDLNRVHGGNPEGPDAIHQFADHGGLQEVVEKGAKDNAALAGFGTQAEQAAFAVDRQPFPEGAQGEPFSAAPDRNNSTFARDLLVAMETEEARSGPKDDYNPKLQRQRSSATPQETERQAFDRRQKEVIYPLKTAPTEEAPEHEEPTPMRYLPRHGSQQRPWRKQV